MSGAVMEPGYRQLFAGEELQDGDEFLLNGVWTTTICAGKKVGETGAAFSAYRRKCETVSDFFKANIPAAVPTPDTHKDLKAILDKEQTHVAQVEENNRRRDETLALGQELTAARKQFADRNRDRLFVVGSRLVSTEGGTWVTKPVEIVSQ